MTESSLCLSFYTKADCSLCETAYAALERVRSRLSDIPLEIRLCDIESNPQWFETYKWLIPVLELNGERLAIYRIDEKQLEKRLRAAWRARQP